MIGKVLGGRYEIIEKIGGGGMALVYKAKCRLLNRYVAIKILRDEFTGDEEFINRFRKESQAAASLSHPNIVGIYDVGAEENIYYIVMEYIKGKTLKELIREKGKLSSEEMINYSIQIAEALEHAHQNHIVHRDIKPHNIMVTDDGRIKVTDFGIARAASSSTVTNTNNVIGSVHYFSPEQARGGFIDEKSDLYSLGIVMYEMITGKVPFEGESPISVALKHIQEEIVPPTEIDSTVPKNIEYVIMKCVRKNQSERYQSATELLTDLIKIKYSNGENVFDDADAVDSPTRIIPVVKEEDVNDMRDNRKKSNVKKKKKKNGDGSNKIIVFGILLAFIVASGLFFGFFKFKDKFISKEIPVPDVKGVNEDVAKVKIEDELGLKFIVKNRVYNSEFKEGDIVDQNVEPDQLVKKGYPIEVTVSKGSKPAKVPNLVNKDIKDIDVLLDEAGLKEGKVDPQYDDVVPRDIVISQDPEPYSEVPEGTKIDIVVSQGPKIKVVPMPKLVGLNINDAKKTITSNGLIAGEVKYDESSDKPKDEVTWQSYEPGTEIEQDTVVDLYVSSGKSGNAQEGNNGVENGGEKTRTLVISLPQDRNETEVKIIRIQDGVSEKVYDKVHNVSEENITITISGKENAKFELYFDDIYHRDIPF